MLRAIALSITLLLALPAGAAVVEGRLALTVDGKALRAEEAREAVVYYRAPGLAAPAPTQDFEMRTEGKQFMPRALPVPVGATVRFPNFDPILHNVFSSGSGKFDLGLYGRGEGRSQVFATPGLVRVYCNVHHDMVGHILVLDTPYFARPDGDGRFRLELPERADGELFVWHERAKLWRRVVDTRAGTDALQIDLELSRPRVPPHTNKFGKPYGDERATGY